MQPFPHRFVIIEGDFDELKKKDERYRKFSDEMIAGKIASLEMKYNIRVLTARTPRKFWIQVERLIWKSQDKSVIEYAKIYKPKLSAENKKDKVLSAICTVQGVSETKGQLISENVKSIPELCKWTVKDLCEIDGIGPVIAKRVKEVF
jgi:ERCC4-type nuclease